MAALDGIKDSCYGEMGGVGYATTFSQVNLVVGVVLASIGTRRGCSLNLWKSSYVRYEIGDPPPGLRGRITPSGRARKRCETMT